MSQQTAQFEALLVALMSPDNTIRGKAETAFSEQKKTAPDFVIQSLLQVGRSSANQELRPFSVILLRRALLGNLQDKSLWDNIQPGTQQWVKQELLVALQNEELPGVRSQLCDAIADIAGDLLEDNNGAWNELLDALLRMSNSQVWYHRQSALIIFSQISPYIIELFTPKFAVIKQILQQGLTDTQNIKVRLAALDASNSFIHTFTEQPARGELQTLLPNMLEVIANCLNIKDEDNAQNALKSFIEIAEMDASFIKPFVNIIIDAMIKIIQAKDLKDSTKQLASEFLVTYIENKPTHSRTIPGFINTVLNILLQSMLDMEDTPLNEWNLQDENFDGTVDIINCIVAQENLDRICLALEGEGIVPDIFNPITQLLNNKQDWKCRHVALMALSMIGEGCEKFIAQQLDQVVNLILPLFDDEHPRVRWAAANVAGQMSTDFGPKFQKKYHSQIIPRFAKLMDDTANPKVQAHTSAAIINFAEHFDSDLCKPYLDGLLNKLLGLIRGGNKIVIEQALSAVASLASCSNKDFLPYYDTFVPILKDILITANQKDQRMLRGKAIECISIFGIAVGKEKFMQDGKFVMELMAKIQNEPAEPDDPQREFILQAWTRISTCLGEDFVPYLQYVMPPLIASASLDAPIRIHDINAPEDDTELGWDYIDMGEAKISIHTAVLDEKAQACHSIFSYAAEMKEHFFPYVEQCSKLLVPLMTFGYHDGVRGAALSIMPELIESTKSYLTKSGNPDRKLLNDLFAFIYPPLVEAVKTETDPEVLQLGIEALHESIGVMGDNTLSESSLKDLLLVVKDLILATQNRRSKLSKSNPEGDADDSVMIREELDKEDDINDEIAEVLCVLVKYHKAYFLPVFQSTDLAQMTLKMSQKTSPPSERQLSICIFDDLIEYTHEQSYPLFNHFIPLMLDYALDPHPGVRQAATYGLGCCAQFGGAVVKPYLPQILEVILKEINQQHAKVVNEMIPPTENAISSLGKIIQYQADFIGDKVPFLVDLWVNWLPIEMDKVEAKLVHQQLCHFIRHINSFVFGPNGKNLPKVLDIFGKIVDTDLVNEETQVTIKEILASLYKQLAPEVFQAAIQTIPADSQNKLRNLK